jgi:hypothetical protein
MAKVKNISIADMVDGQWYVVKTGNTKVNGALVCCKKDDGKIKVQGRTASQDVIEWAYKVMEGQKFVYNGKPNQRLRAMWPFYPKEDSPNFAKWKALKDIEFTEGDFLFREDHEEYYVKSYFDKENYKGAFGLNVAWLDPTFIPEFRDNKYKYLFEPVDIALPKAALGLSELKAISAVQEQFERMQDRHGGTANFICINGNGEHKDHFGEACHAALGCTVKGVKYILSSAFGNGNTKVSPGLKWYVNYLVNDSSFRDAFLLKDVDTILTNNCYIISGDVPGNIVGLACIATRQPWEYSAQLKCFYDLCKLGVPKHLAFLAIQSYREGAFTRGYDGHSVLPTDSIGLTGIINYINGAAVNSHKKLFSESGNYRGVCDSYGTDKDRTFWNGLANLTKGDGWKAKKIDTEDLMKLAKDFLQEWASDNF